MCGWFIFTLGAHSLSYFPIHTADALPVFLDVHLDMNRRVLSSRG